MLRKINHKGMTLVEIIVVMLISSIVMMIVGSMIVSSMTSFNKTTEADKSKLAVDGISKLVRDELIYATDISNGSVPTTKDWNWFSVNKDGHLLRHDKDAKDSIGVEVFNKDYYSNKKLKFFVKTYKEKNDYKIDLKYQFYNSKDELVYGTTYTVGLINMKNGDYPLFNQATTNEIKDGTKLYYKKGNLNGGIDFPDEGVDEAGTVADQKECLIKFNDRGDFRANDTYFKGDMVKYDKYWWIFTDKNSEHVASTPGNGEMRWKKVAGEFDKNSAYDVGDIFYAKKSDGTPQYFKCKKTAVNKGPINPFDSGQSYFEKIAKPTGSNKLCVLDDSIGESNNVLRWFIGPGTGDDTIYDDPIKKTPYLDNGKPYINGRENEIAVYNENEKYGFLAIVKVKDETYDSWTYYISLFRDKVDMDKRPKPGVPPPDGNLYWTELRIDWNINSAYKAGDYVLWNGKWIQAKLDIKKKHNITDSSLSNDPYWRIASEKR
ncbi:MAG: prepilin-type N-terminal cleavage/methylation domain-containing protein [Longicatena sp.]